MHDHQTEMLDCFDENGTPIGVFPRVEIHTNPVKYWHSVVNIWIVDENGELLCSKRSEYVKGNPGKWQTYFGGHLRTGQTFMEAAVSELDEEIGLHVNPKKLHFIEKGVWEPSKHFYESYAYLHDGHERLKFNDGEITEVQSYALDAYVEAKEKHPAAWCNPCGQEARKKILELTQQNRLN
jgi:isopentenyldiphosphate isomerase